MINVVRHPVSASDDLGDPRTGPQIGRESERLRPFQQITLQLFSGLGIQLTGAPRRGPGEDSVASAFIVARTPPANRSSIDAEFTSDLNGRESILEQCDCSKTSTFQCLWTSGRAHDYPLDRSIGH